ncbi:Secretory lipase [Knoellia subterranea KCTC 19937]|uniref:Secretory lipase n=2 Tax=Knoellia TaxID=136099 RepID=A0A0A0JHI3_9MICO|nr:Secretory lipase [Knoellia subterranea KCTC 19937]
MFRRALVPIAALGLVAALAAPAHAGSDSIPGTAGAGTVTGVAEPSRPAFYDPPATIPGTPGTIIRSEPATQWLDPLGFSNLTMSSTRVMYASKNRVGRPIAVTGTIFEPKAPWIGLSSRPLISFAPGTMGIADKCAPSRQLAESFTMYEILFMQGLLTRGYAVALTDYQGLGTPGTHTYMQRVAQGQAVLDIARAALKRSGTSLRSTTPVGFYGYSQGGGAAAAAAELAGSYAPELRVRGTVAGAVPADLGAVAKNLEGSFYAEFLNFALLGLAADNGIDMSGYLNEAGKQVARATEGHCVFDLAAGAFQNSSRLTLDGRKVPAYLGEAPFKGILAANRIGNLKPNAPVLVSQSLLDDVIPYAVGKQLAKAWCGKGTNVRFSTNVGPTHIGGAFPSSAESYAFFEARFAGLPQISNCWTIW